VTGGVALYFGFASTVAAARMFCLILGAIYLLLGIVGFVAPALVAAIIQAHGADVNLLAANIVHLLLGAAFLIVGWLGTPQPTAPTESRA
jgi:predicted small integral membrane protein